ncbi:MAG: hypothetical protein LBV04_07855, partial [Deferribacteraceae bacterium]|nr:hypothetical protein [Deferribacteraceae bacterium]
MISYAFSDYLPVMLALIIFAIAIVIFIVRRINKKFVDERLSMRYFLSTAVVLFLLAGIMLAGIRGNMNLHGQNISLISAQMYGNPKAADLMLNGVFSAYQSLIHITDRKLFFTKDESYAIAR